LKTKIDDAVEDEGDWGYMPRPPLIPELDKHAATLAPVLAPDEWSAVATLAAQCHFTEPLIAVKTELSDRMFNELPERHPDWATARHMADEDKEMMGRITSRIDPALEALTPLINGDRMTRTQRVMRTLRLSAKTLGE